MELSKNANIILERFLAKNKKGKTIETIENMFRRVAKNISKEDKKYKQDSQKSEKQSLEVMSNLEFLPNLPILANAGRKLQQLAACFTLPVEDNIEGIFQSVKNMAIIQKSGGGTGFSFSRLRPEGSIVGETGGIASGPVSFMRVFDCATGAIKEGGIRRGANMGILSIEHPDIEKFITCKSDDSFPNFNISIALTENFMQAVLKNKVIPLVFNKKIYKKVSAKKLFDLITKQAYINGEPGVLFIDEINKHNPLPQLGKIEAINPCGEQPLLPYESCVLGSINLEKIIINNKIDYDKLEKIIKIGVHFLDNSIDASSYPLPEIEKIVKANRKIGLGVMGFANALIKLGIRYDSEEAIKKAEEIMSFIQQKAHEASKELAKIRGPFPNFSSSLLKEKMRNATCTTIAPTGTIGIIANTSPGIEPIFAISFKRYTHFGTLSEKNPLCHECEKNLFVSAHDVSPEYHVRMQSAFQKYTDNAVSKTVNLPQNAPINEIKNIFLLAHKLKCKGLTVYRYKSRKEQVLNLR